jgi:hypothetical protein
MTTQEKALSPEESLQLITETINRTRENISENSFCFLLWGWLIASASFSFFLIHQFTSFKYYFLPFPVLTIAGVITTIAYCRKRNASSVITYLTSFLSMMWLVLGFAFFAIVFINISQSHAPFTYTLIIAAIGTLVSGLVMKFTPLIYGGIVFFAAAIASVYVADDYKVLLHGFAVIFGYLVPGYLLKSATQQLPANV